MKAIQATLAIALILAGALASGPALAWHNGPRVRFGFYFGSPYYGGPYYGGFYPPPYYYYPPPYYYSPPVVVVPSSPPQYIEQGSSQAAPAQPQGDWYYCAEAKAYYPYVKECPGGWQRVPAQPSR